RRERDPGRPTDEAGASVRGERERVAPEDPLHGEEAEDEERGREGRQDVLLPDEPAVEEAERRGHEHDERGGDEEPGRVAGVDLHERTLGAGPYGDSAAPAQGGSRIGARRAGAPLLGRNRLV